MNGRPVIDVSGLPHSVLDHRSPIWWGNLLLIVIETTLFALLVASYFYLSFNFDQWPPPRVNVDPVIYDPVPSLLFPTANLALLLVSCLPMLWADQACLNRNIRTVIIGLAATVACGAASIWLRFVEFDSIYFHWDENAYASVVWTIMVMHLAHIIVGTAENLLMFAWAVIKPLDDKHARDIRVTAVYWYWIALIWIPLYAVIFWVPRLI
jgi:cytochrome c oxidase subunit III